MRTLQNVKFIKSIFIIIWTLVSSIPAMGNIMVLVLLIGYMYSVAGIYLYGELDPANYANLGLAARSFLQVASLDRWALAPLDFKSKAPSMYVIQASFLIIQTFVLLNLLTAVIVDNLVIFKKQHEKAAEPENQPEKEQLGSVVRKKIKTKLGDNTEDAPGIEQFYPPELPLKYAIN
jgi:voltage-gated sodium channel